MKKKVLALVVLAAMLVSILPMAAFAAEGMTLSFGTAPAEVKPGIDATLTVTVTDPKASEKVILQFPVVSDVTFGQATVATTISDTDKVEPVTTDSYTTYTIQAKEDASTGNVTIPIKSNKAGTYSISCTGIAGAATLKVSAPSAVDDISYLRSSVKVDTESAAANGKDSVVFLVSLFDEYWNAIEVTNENAATLGAGVHVATSRGAGAESAAKYSADGGKLKVELTSSLPGSAKVVLGTAEAGKVAEYAQNATGATNITAKAIGDGTNYKFDVTFTAPDADILAKEGSISYSGDAKKAYANGTSYATVKFAVKAASGAPVSGKEVTFSVSGVGATLNKTTATTDATGIVEVRITSTKPGTYYIGAKCGDKEIEASKDDANAWAVTFDAISIDTVKGLSDDNQKIALDTTSSGGIDLKYTFSDANGNKIDIDDSTYNAGSSPKGVKPAENAKELKGTLDGATLTMVTKPTNAKINTEMKYGVDYTLEKTDDNDLKIMVKGERIDKEGDYEIKFTLMNGKTVSYKFNVKKQGTITGLTLSYDAESLPAGKTNAATSVKPSVKLVDAEGYAKKVTLPDSKVSFTVDNAALATIDNTGALKVVSDDTGVIVVTAIHSGHNLVATSTINIVKAASYLKVSPVSIAVGETVKVPVQLVDVDGKPVAIGTGVSSATAEAIVIGKPDGAVVSTNVKSSLLSDVKESGKFSIDVLSNMAGAVKIQVVLKTTENSVNKVYTGSVELNVGKSSGITGNDIIFMIGASSYVVDGKPVASTSIPFIENGRTYLGIRDMGMAMGIAGDANIVWDQAAQTAKLVKDGITVEVTVGATAIKVTKDNVTTEVAIDAPAQNKDGRVYLPFRAVFEAFGYSVEYANGTITCGK